MNTQILKETLAAIKNTNSSNIKNVTNDTFEFGKGRFSYELTKSGKMVKINSVKYLSSVSDYSNCIA